MDMERPPKLAPKAGVLRIGGIIAWIKSRFREPPEHLPSTNPAEEATKSATVGPQPFVPELAERDITDPRVQDWIDQQYRRAIGVSIETDKPPAPPTTSSRNEEAVGGSYRCPSCGQSIRRRPKAGNFAWTHALANFKAFHRCCEQVPSQEEVACDWRKLAVRKVLRYAIGLWAVGMVSNLFGEDARWTFPAALGFFVLCVLFFAVGVPLFLALYILWESGARAWAERIRREWAGWKCELVEEERKRKKERERKKALDFLRRRREFGNSEPSDDSRKG